MTDFVHPQLNSAALDKIFVDSVVQEHFFAENSEFLKSAVNLVLLYFFVLKNRPTPGQTAENFHYVSGKKLSNKTKVLVLIFYSFFKFFSKKIRDVLSGNQISFWNFSRRGFNLVYFLLFATGFVKTPSFIFSHVLGLVPTGLMTDTSTNEDKIVSYDLTPVKRFVFVRSVVELINEIERNFGDF